MYTSGVATAPWKKCKTINHDLCVICQSTSKAYSVVKQPKLESVNRLLESCKIRHENHDSSVTDLFDIIETITAPEFIEKHFTYHRECYDRLTNIKTIEQVVKRYEAAIQTASSNVISRTPGRPSNDQSNKLSEEVQFTPNRRSNVPIFDKNSFIICQTAGVKMHKVEFFQTGQNMLKVAEKLEDKSFYLRLDAIPNVVDAVANDVHYH